MCQRSAGWILVLLMWTTGIANSPASECGRLCDLRWMASTTVAQVEAELDAGADPLSSSKRGHTPLHFAAQANPNPLVAALLIEHGADVDARSSLLGGGTPLHVAAGGIGIYSAETNLYFLHVLRIQGLGRMLERRAEIYRKGRLVGNNAAVVQLLLDKGANVAALDSRGTSPLHWAAAANPNPSVVELLLSRGAEVDARGNKRSTPLHWAAAGNPNPAISRILIDHGADVDAHFELGTPLHVAAVNFNPEVMLLLLKSDGCVGRTNRKLESPLHRAARNPVVEISKHLLDYGGSVEARDIMGRTPLHVALMDNDNADIARLLIERGADVDAQDKEGNSARTLMKSRVGKSREWSEDSYKHMMELLL